MGTYILTARLDGLSRRRTIRAANRFDAAMDAIGTVLNLAMDDRVWAEGAIVLTDSEGKVLHRMDAK